MVNVSIDVTDLGGEARPGDKVVFWRPRMGGSATHAGRVISTAPVTVFLTNGKATVSNVEPGEMTVLLQCRGVESQGPVTVGVPDGNGTVTLRSLIESQFTYAPPIVSAVQEAAANASASERAAIQAQVRSEAAADRADAKVDDAINNGAALVRDEVKQDADRAVSARQAAVQSESNAAASEGAAATSESNAKTSETNAKQSETNAGDFAAASTTAATEAVNAMEVASEAATSIGDSVSRAAASADSASQSEFNAAQYESSAATHAQNATVAAEKVGTAAELDAWAQAAQEAADRVGTAEQVGVWASESSTAAARAEQAEANAKASEESAASSALEAGGSRDSAAASALEAGSYADTVQSYSEQAGQARDEVVPLAQQVAADASATAAHRAHVDNQVSAIDTAFTESVPPYLQEDAPGGLRDTYVSVNEAPLNVQRYGGDLQAALDAASTAVANLGGEVYAPAGTYTGSFNVPANVKLRGAGQRSTRLHGTGASTVLTVGRGSHVSDLFVLGDRTPGGVGVAFRPSEVHVTLRNLSVNGHDTGILLNESWICQIEQSTVQACGTGIRMRGTNNAIQVNGGEIQNCVDGVVQEAESSGWGASFRTTIEGNSGQGVKLLGRSFGFSFADCYFESNAEGHIGVHLAAMGMRVAGCKFLNAAKFGIRADGSSVDGLVVSDSLFNLNSTGDPRAIYVGEGGKNTYIARNHYISGSKGAFDPSVDYKGIRLSWHQDNRIYMAPSARTQSGGGASLNIPHGESPASPRDGDVWTTTEGMFVQINGVTKKITPDPAPEGEA